MKVSEKTLELTLCCQLGWYLTGRFWPSFHGPQPIWFGLTQQQEARAGFDAATRLGNGRILLLQFKAGRQLKRGGIRFHAPHQQLRTLQGKVRNQRRLVFYVLPEVTRTRQLSHHAAWVADSTWFLDIGAIPVLAAPTRRSQKHNLTLDPARASVTISSDPVDVEATRGTELVDAQASFGAQYESFDKFWSYAGLLGRGSVAAGLPRTD